MLGSILLTAYLAPRHFEWGTSVGWIVAIAVVAGSIIALGASPTFVTAKYLPWLMPGTLLLCGVISCVAISAGDPEYSAFEESPISSTFLMIGLVTATNNFLGFGATNWLVDKHAIFESPLPMLVVGALLGTVTAKVLGWIAARQLQRDELLERDPSLRRLPDGSARIVPLQAALFLIGSSLLQVTLQDVRDGKWTYSSPSLVLSSWIALGMYGSIRLFLPWPEAGDALFAAEPDCSPAC